MHISMLHGYFSAEEIDGFVKQIKEQYPDRTISSLTMIAVGDDVILDWEFEPKHRLTVKREKLIKGLSFSNVIKW